MRVANDCKQREIKLREVQRDAEGDYFLEINSPTKALKENSMSDHFKSRFEAELQKSRDSLSKKGGKKNYELVVERVGRAIAKYPSIARHYEITYIRDEVKTANMAGDKSLLE